MKLHNHVVRYPHLQRLLASATPVPLDQSSRVLILSDLHMGDGSGRDEFRPNAGLIRCVLEQHYLQERYSLVLNGDIEELLKFSHDRIAAQWAEFYDLFLRFREHGFFWKIYGNHDLPLLDEKAYRLAGSLVESLRFSYGKETILLFHGHQASEYLREQYSLISRSLVFFLRYIAKPAGIKNYSVPYSSRKKFAIEQSIYNFSNDAKIISIIGHTHRPLFESLSKVDFLKYRIEELCRAYHLADDDRRSVIEQTIVELRDELEACYRKGTKIGLRSGVYNNITVPSVFNSGCTIGKRGITAIEIEGSCIRLVYWHNGKQSRKFISDRDNRRQELGTTGIFRIVLNEDHLDYVFSRIRLLTGVPNN